jgi:glycosyltransferase involved in cell wall biosynthesis
MNWSPQFVEAAWNSEAQVIHAWGVRAARAASSRLRNIPLLLTLLDPAATRDAARWVRAFPVQATVAAGSQLIRSRLIESGLPPDRIVVIRGAVDFAAINGARQSGLRGRIAGDAGPVVLLHGPPSREGGQYFGIWAAALVAQIHRGLKVLMPYGSREGDRLLRFVHQIKMPDLVTVPEGRLGWPELAACADAFLIPAIRDVGTEPIGWAMAAGVPIVGSALRSVCEIIADKHNGLLARPGEPRALAGRILTALEDGDLRHRIIETARAQAYEVFSIRAFADNYARLYENVIVGRPASDGIADTAMVA